MKVVFADTSYFVAMIIRNDVAHARAMAWADKPPKIVTSAWVMSELAAFLSGPNHRALFSTLLATIRSSPGIEFVPATQELFDRGAELYASRHDKAWSLVDCISFVIMQRRSLSDALTTDHHFVQAGFRALLA